MDKKISSIENQSVIKYSKSYIKNLSVKTVEDIKNLNGNIISQLNKEKALEIAKVATRLAKARRTRLNKYLETHNINVKPLAYQELKEKKAGYKYESYEDFPFKAKSDMSLNELKAQIAVSRNFLLAKTSLGTGVKKNLENFARRIVKVSSDKKALKMSDVMSISEKDYNLLWGVYNRIKDLGYTNQGFSSNQERSIIQREIYDVIKTTPQMSKSKRAEQERLEDILIKVKERLDEKYATTQREENKRYSTANRFGLGRRPL